MSYSSAMQQPTCQNMRVRNVHDAQVILHAVVEGKLPMVRRRLDDDDRQALKPGCIYVWEERSSNPHDSNTLESIQRFTDGRAWGPSKARDDFLLYYEKEGTSRASIIQRSHGLDRPMRLVKQTYSAYVDGPSHSRKWHLNAYYSQETFDKLLTIDDFPLLKKIVVPPNRYTCARANNLRRARAANRQSSTDEGDVLDPTTPATRAATTYTTYHQSPPSPYSGEVHLTPPPSHSPSHRQLAPLQYLQNITPRVRNPVDDEQLRSLRHSISAL